MASSAVAIPSLAMSRAQGEGRWLLSCRAQGTVTFPLFEHLLHPHVRTRQNYCHDRHPCPVCSIASTSDRRGRPRACQDSLYSETLLKRREVKPRLPQLCPSEFHGSQVCTRQTYSLFTGFWHILHNPTPGGINFLFRGNRIVVGSRWGGDF